MYRNEISKKFMPGLFLLKRVLFYGEVHDASTIPISNPRYSGVTSKSVLKILAGTFGSSSVDTAVSHTDFLKEKGTERIKVGVFDATSCCV